MAAAEARDNQVKKSNSEKSTDVANKKKQSLGIRLVPMDNSDRPVVSNYSAVNVTPGMAFIDFGFLEPGMLAALQRVGKQGGKLPEKLDAKLAVRLALSYDAMATLQQQLSQALANLAVAKNEKVNGTKN